MEVVAGTGHTGLHLRFEATSLPPNIALGLTWFVASETEATARGLLFILPSGHRRQPQLRHQPIVPTFLASLSRRLGRDD